MPFAGGRHRHLSVLPLNAPLSDSHHNLHGRLGVSVTWRGVATTTGEFIVTGSTLATKFGRLLISTLPPVVLLTTLSTVTDGQALDKERSVKPQAKEISVKHQAKANARSLSAGDTSSQKMIQAGDTRAVDIEATSGSYRLVAGSIKTPSGALFLRIAHVPVLKCPELDKGAR
jgi:hypothetical protein